MFDNVLRVTFLGLAALAIVISACDESAPSVAAADAAAATDSGAAPSDAPAAADSQSAVDAGAADVSTEAAPFDPCNGPCAAGKYCNVVWLGGVGVQGGCVALPTDAGACTSAPACASCFPECTSFLDAGCSCELGDGGLRVDRNNNLPQNDL